MQAFKVGGHANAPFARQWAVSHNFYEHKLTTICGNRTIPGGYRVKMGGMATDLAHPSGSVWLGDVSKWDSLAYLRAAPSGWSTYVIHNQPWGVSSGTGYKYGAAFTAFGFTGSADRALDDLHTILMTAGLSTSRRHYIYGNGILNSDKAPFPSIIYNY